MHHISPNSCLVYIRPTSDDKTFQDLTHLQQFDADWIKIPSKLVDFSDPDCVVKKQGNQYFIWSPIDWVQNYALTKVPLRGRQIACNDSGEGNDFIADLAEDGSIGWVGRQATSCPALRCKAVWAARYV